MNYNSHFRRIRLKHSHRMFPLELSQFPTHQQHITVSPIICLFIHLWFICLYGHLTPYRVSACVFIPFLPLAPPPSPTLTLSLHSMRVKPTKLCLPLPPLLRLSSPRCPSQPVPRWMTARWRRSWRSASGCRWRCRGYGKKTNRSGWDAQKQKGNLSAFSCCLVFSTPALYLSYTERVNVVSGLKGKKK